MLRLLGLDPRGHRKSFKDSMSWSNESILDPPAEIDRNLNLASTTIPVQVPCSQPSLLLKRRMSHDDLLSSEPSSKRAKTTKGESSPKSARARSLKRGSSKECSVPAVPATCDMDKVRATIQHQFGVEILYKHNELRLINQELAKCQIALEQLRRCHLIPYPVNCPTPEQMLHISNGEGPAVTQVGDAVPPWSPPFGVTDGPYARHFAKWLIPDPIFGQMEPKAKVVPGLRARGSAFSPEGRATRNSSMEMGYSVRGRHGRSSSGQKHQHQVLPQASPPVKDKIGPCILKRAMDGQTVRLACLDCLRDDFSSTQGFINHCRISHKRDFKSHEQAAIACGHPIDVVTSGDGAKDEKKKPTAIPPVVTATIHPFSRHDMTDQEAFVALRSRISDSLELYRQGKLPGVTCMPSTEEAARSGDPAGFEPSQETPYLSQLMRHRKFQGSLKDSVANAKIKISWDDLSSGDDVQSPLSSLYDANDLAVENSVMMRMPTRSLQLPGATISAGRPTSSKGRAALKTSIPAQKASVSLMQKRKSSGALSDGELDLEDANLTPNGLVSNIAPSLVSDDGEYDSDEGSSVSGESDSLEGDAVSDVAEISLDDEHDSRALRRGSGSIGSPMKLRKEDAKHVAFIGPVRGTPGERRPGKF